MGSYVRKNQPESRFFANGVKKVGEVYDDKVFSYSKVHYDYDGWADVTKFLPDDYDLCFLKTANRVIHGWFTGNTWDGLRVQEDEPILYWKRRED